MTLNLSLATPEHLEQLLPFVQQYHLFEELESTNERRAQVVSPLLGESSLGRIWLVSEQSTFIGYIAICFCYSIEFGGREAFIDEFYLDEGSRGKGLGKAVLYLVADKLRNLSVRALHLEVAKSNHRAIGLYTQVGFKPRDKYDLYTYEL